MARLLLTSAAAAHENDTKLPVACAEGAVVLRDASFSVESLAPEATPEEDDEAAFDSTPGPTVLTGLMLKVAAKS